MLNLCRIAYSGALAAIVLAGLALSVQSLRRDPMALQSFKFESAAAWAIVLVGLTGFVIATQLAPALYNPYDDFQYFLAHAVRMVETGTLYGSPLNALGGEVLGAQAFLQGFVVGFFPLKFINAADAVFCFFLSLALAGSVAFGRPKVWPAALVGTLAVFLIDPQYENVSSLYSTVAMVCALMIVTVDPREWGEPGRAQWRRAAVPALFYAALIALKNTGLVFCGLHLGIGAVMFCWTTGKWRAGLLNAGRITVWSSIFLAPWLLLYAPYYLVALTQPIRTPLTPVPAVQEAHGIAVLFSPAETFYGGSLLAYTSLSLGLLLCSMFAMLRWRGHFRGGNPGQGALPALASAAAAGVASYLFWVLVGPRLQELTHALRYAIPFLIGACSAALPLWAAMTGRRDIAVCGSAIVLLVIFFASPLRERLGALLHQNSQLAYLHRWNHGQLARNRDFEQWALAGQGAAAVHRLQEKIPPGQPFLAWTATPFLFDFHRNPIIDINIAGVGQLWGRIPRAPYLLLQYDGYGIPTEEVLQKDIKRNGRRVGMLDARALDVRHYLQMIPASKIVADQDNIFLIRLDGDLPPPPN